MRISDWSSDVCSSDLGAYPGRMPPPSPLPATESPHDCPLCPRLVAFREELRAEFPDWWNAPVPAFGDPDAWLAIVGLAPGTQGANRTGRPFTGDYAGDLPYATLDTFRLSEGRYEEIGRQSCRNRLSQYG